MIFAALGVLVLAGLVALGRRPLLARAPARLAALAFAALAAVAAAYDAIKGGWLGGSILGSAALWLFLSSRDPPRPRAGAMTRAEAASVLGVAQDADKAAVETAYRRLILRVHPDQGGAPGLTLQLNAARAVMLGK